MSIEWNGQVHPAARIAPMMNDDRLNELAVDIVANGLVDPIVLLGDGTLIDGRNRLEACKRVNVKPTFVVRDVDPVSFVLSRLQHRDMNSSQRYAIEAQVLANAGKRVDGRWQHQAVTESGKIFSFSETHRKAMQKLGTVIDYRPDDLTEIINGKLSIDSAYKQAMLKRDAKTQAQAARDKETQTAIDNHAQALDSFLNSTDFNKSLDSRDLDVQRGVLKIEQGVSEQLDRLMKERRKIIAELEETNQ